VGPSSGIRKEYFGCLKIGLWVASEDSGSPETALSIRPKHLAEQDFAAFLGRFHNAVTEGHSDYARKYGAEASTHRRNTRRSLIRDHIVIRLRALLDDVRGVHIRDRYGTTYFGFLGRWQVIVRMLGRKQFGVVLNRTQFAFDIQANADDAPPLGHLFRGTTKLYLGYLVPEIIGDQLDVLLVAPDGARNAWHMTIERPSAGEVAPFVPRPAAPSSDDEQLVVVPVRKPAHENDEQAVQSGNAGSGQGGEGSDSD
jgi:hypothetical protein